PRMIGNVGRARKSSRVGTHRGFIFAMCGDRQRGFAKNSFQSSLLIHKQVARTRSDENLDPWRTLGAPQLIDIFGGRPDIESVIYERLTGRERELFIQASLGRRGRFRVGHLEKCRDAALRTSAARSGQVLFVGQTGLTKVYLIVD